MTPNVPLIAFVLLSCVNRVFLESFTVAVLGDGAIFLGETRCENGAKSTLIHRTPADIPTKVARFSGGMWKPEKEYEDRIAPNSSVVFESTTYNDNGVYEVTCGDGTVVSRHELKVVVPVNSSVSVGESVRLPCYLATAGKAAGFIRRERNGELVFEHNLNSGESRDGTGFEGRLSMDGYRQGDASLWLLRAKPEDQGAFLCYREEGQERYWGEPAAVRLTVKTKTDPTDRTTPVPLLTTTPTSTSVTEWNIPGVLSLVFGAFVLSLFIHFLYWWWKSKKAPGTDEGGSPLTVSVKLLGSGSSGAPVMESPPTCPSNGFV